MWALPSCQPFSIHLRRPSKPSFSGCKVLWKNSFWATKLHVIVIQNSKMCMSENWVYHGMPPISSNNINNGPVFFHHQILEQNIFRQHNKSSDNTTNLPASSNKLNALGLASSVVSRSPSCFGCESVEPSWKSRRKNMQKPSITTPHILHCLTTLTATNRVPVISSARESSIQKLANTLSCLNLFRASKCEAIWWDHLASKFPLSWWVQSCRQRCQTECLAELADTDMHKMS